MTKLALLPRRGVLRLTGADRIAFLNGLVSNDVAKAALGQAVWAALLTPQGKYLSDFFVLATVDALLLDTPRDDIPTLLTKLRRYRLRATVELEDASEAFAVYAAWDGAPPDAVVAAPDPRLPEAGWRLLSPTPLPTNATETDYAAHRIGLGLGLPDGAPDLEPEKTLLLEAGFDELHGIAWDKGCYMGQALKKALTAEAVQVTPRVPGWMHSAAG